MDLGEVKSQSIVSFFNDDKKIKLLEKLKEVGVEPKKLPTLIKEGNKFFNKKVVITGKIEGDTREGIISFFETRGAKVTSTISKSTDFLICGAKPSKNKLDKIDDEKIINVINIKELE